MFTSLRLVCLIFLASCMAMAAPLEVFSPETKAILTASQQYVKKETAVKNPNYRVEAVAEDWARVYVMPRANETDPAYLFLHKVKGQWSCVTIGTGFFQNDYKALKVPKKIWVK